MEYFQCISKHETQISSSHEAASSQIGNGTLSRRLNGRNVQCWRLQNHLSN